MHFRERLRQFIAEKELFQPDETLLLAVSGGKDSVLMAHLFAEAGFRFAIAHCNFQLRGQASDADETFVGELAASFPVSFYATRFDTAHYAKQHGLSIQMAARTLRYSWLEKIREAQGYHYIAVGHHQTDSVETMFLNMLRGTGIAGLGGITPRRERIIRPLLGFTGPEVADEVHARSLPFREDISNASTKYTRNAIRLEVLPVLRRINPELEKTMLANAMRFSQVADFLHREVSRLRDQIFIQTAPGEYQIAIQSLKDLQSMQLMLFELFRPYGFTEAVLNDLAREWDGLSGKQFFSATHQLLLNRNQLLLKPRRVSAEEPQIVGELPASFRWYGQQYRACVSREVRLPGDPGLQMLDYDRLSLPLTVRSWQEGDSFRPLGMKGRKKVSDFLIACKLPRSEKAEVPLIVDASGAIAALLSWRIDDRFKVTQETKKVLIFEKISHG